MAEEKIEYVFEGDVTSLKQATDEALSLLSQFSEVFKKASESGSMKTSITAQKEFQRAVNSTIDSLKKLSDTQITMQVPSGVSSQYGALGQSIKDTSDILKLLGTSTKTNSSDLQIYSDSLRTFRQVLDDARTQIVSYNLQFKETAQEAQRAIPSVEEVGDTAEESGEKFEEASEKIRDATDNLDEAGKKAKAVKTPMDSLTESFSNMGLSTLKSNPMLQDMLTNFFKIPTSATAAAGGADGLSSALGTLGASGSSAAAGTTAAAGASAELAGVLPPQIALALLAANAMKQMQEAVLGVVKSLAKLALNTGVTIVTSIGNAYVELVKFTLGIKDADDKSKGFIETLAQLAIGLQLGKAFGEAVKGQIDFIENTNLFTVAMGESIEVGNKFVDSLAEIYGLDPSNIIRATGLFNQLTSAMEAPAEASEIMSLGFTKAAIDVASLFNTDFETATQDLTAGLQGMSRSVRKYGLDIRISTLQQKAFELGLQGQVETMSESTRQGLRFLTMMEQLENVHGDFANTLTAPANQLRILKEQMAQLSRTIGSLFVPVLQSVLPVINGFVMGLRLLIETVGAFFGIEMQSFDTGGIDDASGAIGGVGDAAGSAAKKMKDLLAPWDELNILAEQTASSAGGAGGGLGGMTMDPLVLAQIKEFELSLESVRMKALDVRDAFLAAFGLQWVTTVDVDTGEITRKLEALPGGFADRVAEKFKEGNWTGIGQEVAGLMNIEITKAADLVSWDNLGPTITDGMQNITDFINGWAKDFSWSEVGRLLGNSINTIFNTVDLWFKGINIIALTNGVTTTIKDAAAGTDWVLIGKTIGAGLNFFFDGIVTLVTTLPWTDLAIDLTTMLNNAVATTNWTTIGQSFDGFFNGALDFLSTTIDSFGWTELGEGLGEAFKAVEWGTILKKVADLIFNKLTGALIDLFKGAWTGVTTEAQRSSLQTGTAVGSSLLFGATSKLTFKGINTSINAPIIAGIAILTDFFFGQGKDSGEALISGAAGDGGTPIEQAVNDRVVGPVNQSLESISEQSKLVGQNSAENFQSGIAGLPSWYQDNVALKINAANGSIGDDFGTMGSKATTNFQTGVENLPSYFSEDITSEMSSSLTSVSETADTESAKISNYFKANLGQLPGWNSTNITDPIKDSYQNMTDSITSNLSSIISKTNAAISAANDLASANKLSGGASTQIGNVPTPPASKNMATGGVVTRRVVVGEGKYDEAIIPLGDSPQLDDMISRIASAVGQPSGATSGQPIAVDVYIGGEKYDTFTYKAAERGKKLVGAQPITVGG